MMLTMKDAHGYGDCRGHADLCAPPSMHAAVIYRYPYRNAATTTPPHDDDARGAMITAAGSLLIEASRGYLAGSLAGCATWRVMPGRGGRLAASA